jgi:hypothetical protein
MKILVMQKALLTIIFFEVPLLMVVLNSYFNLWMFSESMRLFVVTIEIAIFVLGAAIIIRNSAQIDKKEEVKNLHQS